MPGRAGAEHLRRQRRARRRRGPLHAGRVHAARGDLPLRTRQPGARRSSSRSCRPARRRSALITGSRSADDGDARRDDADRERPGHRRSTAPASRWIPATASSSSAGDSNGTLVRGLVVNGSETNGIAVISDENTIEDTYVGTNRLGTAAVPNLTGILVTGNDNDIGGYGRCGRNVVSGNAATGMRILGDRNSVRGNYVGLTSDGDAALRNDALGIETRRRDREQHPLGNVVSGSDELIWMTNAIGTSVIDNLLGTDATGTSTRWRSRRTIAGISIDGGSANEIGNVRPRQRDRRHRRARHRRRRHQGPRLERQHDRAEPHRHRSGGRRRLRSPRSRHLPLRLEQRQQDPRQPHRVHPRLRGGPDRGRRGRRERRAATRSARTPSARTSTQSTSAATGRRRTTAVPPTTPIRARTT